MADRRLYVAEVRIQRTNGLEANRHEWIVADDMLQAETYATSLAESLEQQDNIADVTLVQLQLRQNVWVAPVTP